MPTKNLRLLLIAVILQIRLPGQFSDSDFVRYTFKDGLNSNYITALQQDELGYIWVGTTSGLNRFDGLSFNNFATFNDIQLPTGAIRRLEILEGDRLGIMSEKGLHVLDTRKLSYKHFFIQDSSVLSTSRNATWDAQLLPGGAIAVSTATGFHVFDKHGKIEFRYDAFTPKDYGKRILYGRDMLKVSPNDLLIYIHDYGLAHYDISRKVFHESPASETQWDAFRVAPADSISAHNSLTRIGADEYLFTYQIKDSIGYYHHGKKSIVNSPFPFPSRLEFNWACKPVAVNDTLFAINSSIGGFFTFILDRKTGKIRFNPTKFLKGYTVDLLFVDQEKRLWVGTRNGLLRQRIYENFLQVTYYEPAPDDLAIIGFQSSFRYKDKLYVSRFSRTNGLVVIDTATNQVVKRINFFGGNSAWNEIVSMIMYHPDTLWLGTAMGPVWLDTRNYSYGKIFDPVKYPLYPEAFVHFYPVNKDGYAWFFFFMEGFIIRYHVASRRMDLINQDTRPAFPFKRIKSIAYDSYGDVWFGGHALARWNSREERFDTMMTVYGGANKYHDNILTMSPDENGSLWLHNVENGLLEYRIKEKKFIAYTTKDGLPSMILQCFSPVVNDQLWFSTANTLSRFNTRTKKTFVYDHNDGFPDESPNNRKIFYDAELNKMFLYCKNYIVTFPAIVSERPSVSRELLIQEFRVNDKKSWYHPDEKLELKHYENTINIRFNIIDLETPNSYLLSYRIDDEEDWTLAGPVRSLQLKGLQPGEHKIELKATGKNGEENLKQLVFRIGKPFWKTNAFIISSGLLLAGLVIYLYRRRLAAIHQKANIDKQIAQTQMKALHAQMNPHFVFNSLNSIREMILNNESKEASHFLSKFAQLMRMTLDHSVKSFVSLRSTMEYLERYMEMEQVRNDKFTCRILADDELDRDEILLPPMLIQPFIENAIWHGITETRKDININIDFKKAGEQLVCIIDDDGVGIDRSIANKKNNVETHTSVGIANIQNRIQLLNEKYGLACSIEIIDKSNLPGQLQGTRVTIRLPIQIDE